MKPPGKIRIKLAFRLQNDIPSLRGKAITWSAERLYPQRGRPYKFCDRYAFIASPVYQDSGNSAGNYNCYDTMTQCVKAKRLILCDNMIELE